MRGFSWQFPSACQTRLYAHGMGKSILIFTPKAQIHVHFFMKDTDNIKEALWITEKK